MKIGNIEIFRDRENRTGLSVAGGEAIEDVSQLPEFRIEVHVFINADAASAFVSGIELAGIGNNLVYDWQTGELGSNRTVIVGRLDEMRPDGNLEEAVRIVCHKPSGLDGKAISDHLEQRSRQLRAEEERERKEAAVVGQALAELNLSGWETGRGWCRFTIGNAIGVSVSWSKLKGPFKVEVAIDDLLQGYIDVSADLASVAEKHGYRLDKFDACLVDEGVPDLALLGERLGKVATVLEACRTRREKVYHEDFVIKTKMTASRRRFLEVAHRFGISRFHKPRSGARFKAGDLEIGQAEISTLLKVGWIEENGRGYSVTPKGIEVSGIS